MVRVSPAYRGQTLVPGVLVAGRYRVRDFLGRGGVGDVYLVEDLELDVEVALKLLRPEAAQDPEMLTRFRHEVVLARRLEGSHVARIFDMGSDGDSFFITMEYLPGPSLSAQIAERAPFPPGRTVELTCQICDAVGEAHSLGIVHRDLKPQNILFDSNGRIKVTDFGMAYAPDISGDTSSGAILGTPQYMAPEQAEGLAVDPRTDVYAIGLILYEMLTGVFPFATHNPITSLIQRLKKRPISPSTYVSDIPGNLEQLILQCLERNPKRRPKHAGEILRILRAEHPDKELTLQEQGNPHRVLRPLLLLLGGLVVGSLVWMLFPARTTYPGRGRPLVISHTGGELSEGLARHLVAAISWQVDAPVRLSVVRGHRARFGCLDVIVDLQLAEEGLRGEVTLATPDTLASRPIRWEKGHVRLRKLTQWILGGFGVPSRENAWEGRWDTNTAAFVTYARGLAAHNETLLVHAAQVDPDWPWPSLALGELLVEHSPADAAHALQEAQRLSIPAEATLLLRDRIELSSGEADAVLSRLLTRSILEGFRFDETIFAARVAALTGGGAARGLALFSLFQWSQDGEVALMLAEMDRGMGNEQGAIDWAHTARRDLGASGDILTIEALARLQDGEPEQAQSLARELLRMEHSARAYALIAEAALRQRELLEAFEAAEEGVSRFPENLILRHELWLAATELGAHGEHSPVPPDSISGLATPHQRLAALLYSAPSWAMDCEKLWWKLAVRHPHLPETWLVGAWIARFLERPEVVCLRLERAQRAGLSARALCQDIRFVGWQTG